MSGHMKKKESTQPQKNNTKIEAKQTQCDAQPWPSEYKQSIAHALRDTLAKHFLFWGHLVTTNTHTEEKNEKNKNVESTHQCDLMHGATTTIMDI